MPVISEIRKIRSRRGEGLPPFSFLPLGIRNDPVKFALEISNKASSRLPRFFPELYLLALATGQPSLAREVRGELIERFWINPSGYGTTPDERGEIGYDLICQGLELWRTLMMRYPLDIRRELYTVLIGPNSEERRNSTSHTIASDPIDTRRDQEALKRRMLRIAMPFAIGLISEVWLAVAIPTPPPPLTCLEPLLLAVNGLINVGAGYKIGEKLMPPEDPSSLAQRVKAELNIATHQPEGRALTLALISATDPMNSPRLTTPQSITDPLKKGDLNGWIRQAVEQTYPVEESNRPYFLPSLSAEFWLAALEDYQQLQGMSEANIQLRPNLNLDPDVLDASGTDYRLPLIKYCGVSLSRLALGIAFPMIDRWGFWPLFFLPPSKLTTESARVIKDGEKGEVRGTSGFPVVSRINEFISQLAHLSPDWSRFFQLLNNPDIIDIINTHYPFSSLQTERIRPPLLVEATAVAAFFGQNQSKLKQHVQKIIDAFIKPPSAISPPDVVMMLNILTALSFYERAAQFWVRLLSNLNLPIVSRFKVATANLGEFKEALSKKLATLYLGSPTAPSGSSPLYSQKEVASNGKLPWPELARSVVLSWLALENPSVPVLRHMNQLLRTRLAQIGLITTEGKLRPNMTPNLKDELPVADSLTSFHDFVTNLLKNPQLRQGDRIHYRKLIEALEDYFCALLKVIFANYLLEDGVFQLRLNTVVTSIAENISPKNFEELINLLMATLDVLSQTTDNPPEGLKNTVTNLLSLASTILSKGKTKEGVEASLLTALASKATDIRNTWRDAGILRLSQT